MERISIFNYEAFYLDYLEGNLSEKDTAMLLQFLEEHPECRMEDEDLVLLDDEGPMTFSGKESLKQVDESGPIGMENVEHFMIADAERLLTDEKKEELNNVVANNEDLEATRRRYNAVYYTPDESVVYGAKSDLKQRKTLVLWPYMSGAVAAAAVVVVMLMTNVMDGSIGTVDIPVAQGPEMESNEQNQGGIENEDPIVIPANEINENTSTYTANATDIRPVKERPVIKLKSTMDRFGHAQISPTKTSGGDVKGRPVSIEPIVWTSPESSRTIPAFGPDMENPIEPVTAFISEKAKTDIDFKRRKASKKKKGGFFLKIGNFEVSKNKH